MSDAKGFQDDEVPLELLVEPLRGAPALEVLRINRCLGLQLSIEGGWLRGQAEEAWECVLGGLAWVTGRRGWVRSGMAQQSAGGCIGIGSLVRHLPGTAAHPCPACPCLPRPCRGGRAAGGQAALPQAGVFRRDAVRPAGPAGAAPPAPASQLQGRGLTAGRGQGELTSRGMVPASPPAVLPMYTPNNKFPAPAACRCCTVSTPPLTTTHTIGCQH